MTWLDVVLLVWIAALTALGAQRKMTGLLVGVGGVALLRILLVVFAHNAAVGLLFALAAGLLLGFAGRALIQRRRGSALPAVVLGGVGGFLLGVVFVLVTVTSLPIERNLNNQLVYPPRDLPLNLRGAVINSRLVSLGRDILLYPLLVRDGVIEPSGVKSGLHAFFVVGEPWNRRL